MEKVNKTFKFSPSVNPQKTMKLIVPYVLVAVSIILILWGGRMMLFKDRDDENHVKAMMLRFREQEEHRVTEVLDLKPESLTETKARDMFYKVMSFPLQGVCRTLKRLGGYWHPTRGAAKEVDGDKFVCMDRINNKKDSPQCMVYSFGINNDWTFEDFMDSSGCTVHGFDHTVDFPSRRGSATHFYKLGLGSNSASMKSLPDILKMNGHQNTTIDYLKIDIEGSELAQFKSWISSGSLNQVNQIAIELHLGSLQPNKKRKEPRFRWLLVVLQDLYKLGFRVISHEVNMVQGKGKEGFYNYFETVLMKDNVWNVLNV